MINTTHYPAVDTELGARYFSRHPTEPHLSGVQFALYAADAHKVELCLFDDNDHETRVTIPDSQPYFRYGIWSIFLADLKPGQKYGYRIYGEWNPQSGQRHNPAKLLIDPYARKLYGQVSWHKALYDYERGENNEWLICDENSAPYVPRSVVVGNDFDWGDSCQPRHAMADSVIYELNVRGFTMQYPEIPVELRGTYRGLCHPKIIEYLKDLGVTAVELMPVTSFCPEHRLTSTGLDNYWGYNPLALMAPEPSMAVDDPVEELKTMVRTLHEADIEVILDVVFNHTCEGGTDGPTFSFRGIDNCGYYLLHERSPEHSINHSGCGNTLRVENPPVLKMVTDCLRMWVQEYQIDGFRFDLAPIMGRKNWHFDRHSPFFQALYQDPVLGNIKLIAEPWDLAPDGYQLGNFPQPWSEWNDRYRDCVRSFWRGDQGLLGQMTERLCGSSDIYRWNGRSPSASINYLCSHDGFTLHDLVSYSHKHNKANGEDNQDGDNHNFSWNCGIEGPTNDLKTVKLRERYKRSLLTTLFLSNGAVMLQAGDEFGNTQQGNNNAYCQNNPIGWLNWSWLQKKTAEHKRNHELICFVRALIRQRKAHKMLRRDRFLCGIEEDPENYEVLWRTTEGRLMRSGDWQSPKNQYLFMHLRGDVGEPCECDLLVLFNASAAPKDFRLPSLQPLKKRTCLLSSAHETGLQTHEDLSKQKYYSVEAHSVVIFKDQCIPGCPLKNNHIIATG